jgi:hypothetical protein
VQKEILKHLTDLKKISHNPASALQANFGNGALVARQEKQRKLKSLELFNNSQPISVGV